MTVVATPEFTIRDNGIVEFDGALWETPLTHLPDQTVGTATLAHGKQRRGYYSMEGVAGIEVYEIVKHPMIVSELQVRATPEKRRGNIWMVDDPLHWFGMKATVDDIASDMNRGQVLYCAGLGLGLMVHHLRPVHEWFDRIVVVERTEDVIELIKPTLPEIPNLEIVHADWWQYVHEAPMPGGVLWDLAVGGPEDTRGDIFRAKIIHEVAWGDIPLRRFGVRSTPRPQWLQDVADKL